MKFLFVHRSFPGQFLHLVSTLAAQAEHQVAFIAEPGPNRIAGVALAEYAMPPPSRRTHPAAQEFDSAQRRAQAVAEVAMGLRSAGFQPDLIVGHEAWGEMLNLADIWPDTPAIAYREYFYHLAGADVGFDPEFPLQPGQAALARAKNAVGLLGLHGPARGVSPTAWQRGLYPDWARPRIAVVPDGIDLALCRPDPAAKRGGLVTGAARIPATARLVTFVARDLEPYRGFHTLMRAVPLLMARPDLHVLCVGGDGVSYGLAPPQGNWRERMLAEIGTAIDPARLHFTGRISHAAYRRVLQRSDVHVYLSYPFIASWSLREAMACGCAIVAGDTVPVREFITPDVEGALVPCLDPAAVAERVLTLLEAPTLRAALGQAARQLAEREMGLPGHLAGWQAVMRRALGVP